MYNLHKYIPYIGIIVIVYKLLVFDVNAQDSSFTVFAANEENGVWMKYTDNANAFYHYEEALAKECLSEREKQVSLLKSEGDWQIYSNEVRMKCFSGLSGFIKTPLNAKVTGVIEKSNYKVEKVVYESIPGFYVTGCLFIPKNIQKPAPAVLVAIGHSQAAFRRDLYQQNILNLVSKGFVVFTCDPLGQGERTQYYDPVSKQSLIGDPCSEHSYAGAQCLLLGHSISDYFIWDGVRALDYLFSRPEVDTTRIGMTGISGGGTQTAFLSAYDKRISAAAPESYITSFERLFESVGPQDAEQNLYNGLKQGIDHVDLLSMRAPKPTMIISTTQDFFSIQGARETFDKAKGIFTVYGRPENITMAEADGTHGSTKDNRERMYHFFRQNLNLPGNNNDEKVDFLNEAELTVTTTGQVSTALNSKSVFDVNKDKGIQIINKRLVNNSNELIKNLKYIKDKIVECSGYDSIRSIHSVVFTGKVELKDYKIEKYFIQGENFDYPIPFVLIKPYSDEKRPLLLYLSSSGKDGLSNHQEEIKSYINMGYSILAPDLLGMGELKNARFKEDSFVKGYSYNLLFGANLVGKSIPGMQASDLNVLFRAIKNRRELDFNNITSIVNDETCSSYLHFAVFNKNIKKTILVNPLISYEDILMTKYYDPRYMWTAAPGAVPYYDMSLLESLLAPHELVIIDPVTSKGEVADTEMISKQNLFLRDSYKMQKALDHLQIVETKNKKPMIKLTDYIKIED